MKKRIFQPLASTVVTLAVSLVTYPSLLIYCHAAFGPSGPKPENPFSTFEFVLTTVFACLVFVPTWWDAGNFTRDGKPVDRTRFLSFTSREAAFYLLVPLSVLVTCFLLLVIS